MVTVKVVCAKDLISSIEIEGHAGFDDSGKDLVCAGASSISIGIDLTKPVNINTERPAPNPR